MDAARQELAPVAESHPAPANHDSAIISMIERAARDPNVDIEKLERLMAMQERAQAQRAVVAFSSGFAEMQDQLPEIAERGKGHGTVTYARWEDINDAIKPVLSRHGFGLRFEVGRANDRLSVTGILMHRDGHSERTTIELPADTSGSKNAVQAVGSSTSYGKRYVAAALLNLTSRLAEDRDDDGVAGGRSATINDEQIADLNDLIESTGSDRARFCRHMKVASLAELPATKFAEAVAELKRKEIRR